MPANLRRWIVPALVIGVPFCGFALSGHADTGVPEAKDARTRRSSTGDLTRAKEIAELIAEGQMSLPDATAMAEKHQKGTAIEVRCDLVAGEPKPIAETRSGGKPGTEQEKKGATGARLIYDVSCFAKNQLETVRVDGLARKVLSEGERSGDAPPKP